VTRASNDIDPEAWLADVMPGSMIIRSIGSTNCSLELETRVRKQPRHLEQLEQALLDLGDEAMLLPSVRWRTMKCARLRHGRSYEQMLTLVMAHYDDMARNCSTKPERYALLCRPTIVTATFCGSCGFEKAVKLRPAAWRPSARRRLGDAKAMSGLLPLADVARRDERVQRNRNAPRSRPPRMN